MLTELMQGLDAVPPASDVVITGMTSDSRAVEPGTLFAALPGAKLDGGSFIAQAVAKGAVAILGKPGTEASVPVITGAEPRRLLAQMAARFYGPQPETVIAVTGTNGKTSVAAFTRQIWQAQGIKAASIGTLGLVITGQPTQASLTTPDPVTLHRTLGQLATDGVGHVALEASSHGLDQFRLDGVVLKAAGFTNLTRDHLDYHLTMEAYLRAKAGLFGRVLPEGGTAVINADTPHLDMLAAIAVFRRQEMLRYGLRGAELRLLDRRVDAHGQTLRMDVLGKIFDIRLPLVGAFQSSNALCALGLAIGSGVPVDTAVAALENLQGAPGRLQQVGVTAKGAPIFVDYAHTPDALQTVLSALRPHAAGKLVVVFGCGGDRDPGKRPLMGGIATLLADRAIVTDDNPRSEDAALIRKAILAGVEGPAELIEIGDRAEAIQTAIADLSGDDVLIIAGKGHEQGQIVGDTVIPFDDAEIARDAIGGRS